MAEVAFENATLKQLYDEFFTLLPEPDDISFDEGKVIRCATALLELHRRACDKHDVARLIEVNQLITVLRNTVTTIQKNGGRTESPILLPGKPGFHL